MKVVFGFSVWFLVGFFAIIAQASGWIQYGTSPSGSMQYYDETGIVLLPDGVVQVTVRMIFSDEEIRRYLQYRAQGNLPTRGYANVKYAELVREINCRRKEITTITVREYSADNKPLSTFGIDQNRMPFVPIEPASMDENLYRAVCFRTEKR